MLRYCIAASLLLTACDGSSGIALGVDGVGDRSDTPGYAATAPGSRLLAIQVTVRNNTGATVPLVPSVFFLEPASGTSLPGHALTATFADGCGGGLAPDRSAACAVAFDVPATFVPVQIALEYDGQRATAPVSLGGLLGDAGPDPDGGVEAGTDAGPPPGPTSSLDLLFMIDNSNSMSEEQTKLIAELPLLVRVLGSGDFDQDGTTTGVDDFPPFDMNLGIVTSDMGTGGFTVPTCARSDFGDDGILRTQGNTSAFCMATYPTFLNYRPGGSATTDEVAADLACVAAAGTGGCGFEQQLEASLKAASPAAPTAWTSASYAAPMFYANTFGHADRENDGFFRADSVLAIVPVTDEEDCSARDPELFNPSSPVYGATDLNLRCFAHADAALHPISRFVDGFVQLRRHPSRLVYAPIAGIPQDLAPAPGARPDWVSLVSPDPSLRDDRMEERVDPSMPTRLLTSCTSGDGSAYPPVRIVRVAEELEAAGAHVTVRSICDGSFRSSILEVARQIRDAGR